MQSTVWAYRSGAIQVPLHPNLPRILVACFEPPFRASLVFCHGVVGLQLEGFPPRFLKCASASQCADASDTSSAEIVPSSCCIGQCRASRTL